MFARIFGGIKTQKPTVKPTPQTTITPDSQGIQFSTLSKDTNNLGLSYDIYDKFHQDINKAITEYNSATSSEAKKDALKKIQEAIQYVDLHAPPKILASAGQFHRVKKDLFSKIKEAYAENGIHTISRSGKSDHPVAHILANMSPDKADELMEILHRGSSEMKKHEAKAIKQSLKELYDSSDNSPEAKQWRDFLKNHSIEFLGGGNSKNYKVTNTDTSSPHYGTIKVLKIDNRLGMPRHVEHHLRQELGDVFTPIDADRQVRGTNPEGKLVSRTLLVTDFCTSGSVDEHRGHLQRSSDIYKGAANLMGQMAQVFQDIQKANCCFPDAKLTNWLVDTNGTIRLADTKSFVFTQNGEYSYNLPGNENVDIIRTNGFDPMEIDNPQFNAEKLHAFILGKNIYTYLTNEWPDNINFNNPIFKGPIGQEYKTLIENLIRYSPNYRMGIQDAQDKLLELEIRLEPKFKVTYEKTSRLSAAMGVNLKALVADLKKDLSAGMSEDKAAKKINNSLNKLEEVSTKCDQLMKQISEIKINGNSIITQTMLQKAKADAMHGAKSIDDLRNKLKSFAKDLKQDLANKTNLEKTSAQCDQLMKQISDIKIDGKSIITHTMLQEAKNKIIHDAKSIGDLGNKLESFAKDLKKDLAEKTNLEKTSAQCDQLMQQISDIKINGTSIITQTILQEAKKEMIHYAKSIGDLSNELERFATDLQQDLDRLVACDQLIKQISDIKINGNSIITQTMLQEAKKEIIKNAKSISDLSNELESFATNLQKNLDTLDACDQLINDIGDIKINGSSIIPQTMLQKAEDDALQGAESYSDFSNNLESFGRELYQDWTKLKEASEYQQLKQQLEALKFGKNDKQMDAYLSKCDQALMKGESLDEKVANATELIKEMKAVIVGLNSNENKAVKNIIKKFDDENRWYTINTDKKARGIENAMANVPIEHRANLLKSKDKSVTEVLKAIAWNRLSFTNVTNDAGKIKVESAATSFKKFKDQFKDTISSREDIEVNQDNKNTPKMK